jgi:hypothetical protein
VTTNSKNHESLGKEKSLLSSEEHDLLTQIATKEPPHSQRAEALLAIDGGTTQAEADRLTGLTIGQVRYWLTKFRKDRMGIFPEELLIQARQVEVDLPQISAKRDASPDLPDPEPPEGEEDSQQKLLDAEETAGPADSVPARQESTPEYKKKKSKRAKKSKTKEPKKDKKALKGKKQKKKTKMDKSQKSKGKRGKASKKKRKS